MRLRGGGDAEHNNPDCGGGDRGGVTCLWWKEVVDGGWNGERIFGSKEGEVDGEERR